MLKKILLLIICFCVAILPKTVIAQADKIYERNNHAVVTILTYNEKQKPLAQGSGFFVRPDGAVVTNMHVIDGAVSIKIKMVGGKVLEAEGIIYSAPENDLVILKTKGDNLPVLMLGDSDKVKPGEKVYVIGSPAGLENTISDGILSGVRNIGKNQKVIQISAPISPGSSGGPVFNEAGEVIGAATFVLEGAQNLNFAMPINLIKDKVNNKNITNLSSLDKSKVTDITGTFQNWIRKVNYLLAEEKYKEAKEASQRAIEINPNSEEGHYLMAWSCYYLKDYQNALKACKKSIDINPAYVDGHCAMGWIYQAVGYSNEAIASFTKTIKLDPKEAAAYHGLGVVYYEKDELSNAVGHLKKSIEYGIENKMPDDLMYRKYKSIGFVYEKIKDYPRALNALREAVKLKIDDNESYFVMGRIHLRLRNYSSATDLFKKTIKTTEPNSSLNILATYNLGLIYVANGNKEKARKMIQDLRSVKGVKDANLAANLKTAIANLEYVIANPKDIGDLIK
mgnify:CR=1 FL=1